MLNYEELQRAFALADAAKNRGDYQLANALFAFILQQHAQGATQVRIGYEYAVGVPYEDEDEYGTPYTEILGADEGNPCDWGNTFLTHENVCLLQYHGLVFVYMGGTAEKPVHYLCIPAPKLSTECLRYCFKFAKRAGNFMPRRAHNREGGVERKPTDITLATIGTVFPSFHIPAWVLEHPIDYPPVVRTPRVGGRGSTKNGRA